LETILREAQRLSPEELAQLIKQAADLLARSRQVASPPTPRYVSLFGSGKGSYATPEEADNFVREERSAWE